MKAADFKVAAACEIVSSRLFDAPPAKVFRAWADPEILKEWWGPAGFTNTFHEFDPQPGGKWRFTMHGPEKGNYENEVVFRIVDEPDLIVWDRISQPLFRVVTTFEAAENGKTMLVFRMQFENEKLCATIRQFAPEKNEENFDKLEKQIAD
jgi:uncharacterized protein YndB with AHSA1/START domain